jgi:asparagine synthase (glutamine-hydrolysing)
MCGIAGIFGSKLSRLELSRILEAMNAAQIHRGPDESGLMVDESSGSGLASCRLSIIDLERGRQPISNEDQTVHVVLNGEIYNHNQLRHWLIQKGHAIRSRSDTEVLVHLYEERGEDMLEKLEGMFAFAVYDAPSGRLLLARDGPGMKPLYIAQTAHGFLFASEVKALFATGMVAPAPDLAALDAYLAAGYVPAPLSMFQGIRKLEAGHYVVVSSKGLRESNYWSPRFQSNRQPVTQAEEYEKQLEELLSQAVRSHLAADVPVGAFLSGGWDSSLVTTLAVRQATSRLKTFSIVFPEDPQMDESAFSSLVAARLATEHYVIEYRLAQFPEILLKLIRHLEEPCTTAPAGVMFHLASLAAAHVKTVVSGEGADELFGGYEWVRLNSPYVIRKAFPRRLCQQLGPWCPHQRLQKLMRIFAAKEDRVADAEWRRLFPPNVKQKLLRAEFRNDGPDLAPFLVPDKILASCSDSLERRLAIDIVSRLAEGILFVSDKVSMAHSLEVRMPFLDRSVVDFALGLPSWMKVFRGREKRVLAGIARRYLPEEIAQRRKHGLGYPSNMWRHRALMTFARQLLLDSTKGPFSKPAVEQYLVRHCAPSSFRGINALVFLQAWWNEFLS